MKLTNTIRDAFIRSAMDDVPSIDYTEQIRAEAMKLAVAALPPKVRACYQDKDLSGFVVLEWITLAGVGLRLPCKCRADAQAFEPKLNALFEKSRQQRATADSLRSKLKSVAYSATTRAKLAEMLPEFEKYLPADEQAAIRTLPALANVVTDFVQAGWPKGKRKGALHAKAA